MKRIFLARLVNQPKDQIYIFSKSRWKWFQNPSTSLLVIKKFLENKRKIPFWNRVFMEWKGSILDFKEIQKISHSDCKSHSHFKSIFSRNIKDYSMFHKPIEFMTCQTFEEGILVQPSLLIPRLDTVSWANKAANKIINENQISLQSNSPCSNNSPFPTNRPLNILEFGVGSGIIAKILYNNFGKNLKYTGIIGLYIY